MMTTTLRRLLSTAAALLVALVTVIAGAQPAFAGNWAVTLIDPGPSRYEAGTAYPVGFWVLQHGSHPFDGVLDPVGLRFTDSGNRSVIVSPGTRLPEAAHYTTTVTLPAGTYAVHGLQGEFAAYRVGTITVPGTLEILAAPPPLEIDASELPWTTVRPPAVPVDANRGPFSEDVPTPVPPVATTGTDAVAAPAVTPSSTESRATTALAVVACLALLLGLGLAYRRRRTSTAATPADAGHTPDQPIELDVSSRS